MKGKTRLRATAKKDGGGARQRRRGPMESPFAVFPGTGIVSTADNHVSPNACVTAFILVGVVCFLFIFSVAVSVGYENVHGAMEADVPECPDCAPCAAQLLAARRAPAPGALVEIPQCPAGTHELHGVCALNVPRPDAYDEELELAGASACDSMTGRVCGKWSPEHGAPWRNRAFDWADMMNALRLNHTVRSDADLTQLTGLGGDFHDMTRLCVHGSSPRAGAAWLERGLRAHGPQSGGWRLGWAVAAGAQSQLLEIYPVRHPHHSRRAPLALLPGRQLLESEYDGPASFAAACVAAGLGATAENADLCARSSWSLWREAGNGAWDNMLDPPNAWRDLGHGSDFHVHRARDASPFVQALLAGWAAGLRDTLAWVPLHETWGVDKEALLRGLEDVELWLPTPGYLSVLEDVMRREAEMFVDTHWLKVLAALDASVDPAGAADAAPLASAARLADPMALGANWEDWRKSKPYAPHTTDTHAHRAPQPGGHRVQAQQPRWVEEAMAIFDATDGVSDPEERAPEWERCAASTAHYLPEVVDSTLADHVLRDGLRDRLVRLVRECQQTWADVARDSGKFSEEGLRRILQKQDAMALRIGVPTRVGGPQWCAPPVLHSVESWTEAALRVRARNYAIWVLGELPWLDRPPNQRPAGERRWLMEGVVNAWFDPAENSMNIPPYILVPPLAHPSFSDAALLASLGFVAMHEASHSSDRVGRHWDHEGAYNKHWLPDVDARLYENFDVCLAQDYSRRTALGHWVAGVNTNGEDSADVRGAQLALWTAERLGLDLRHFLGVLGQAWCSAMTADEEAALLDNPHSVPQQRVDGISRHLLLRNGTSLLHLLHGCPRPARQCLFP